MTIKLDVYKDMIYKWAWRVHNEFGLPMDELESVGTLAFYEARANYDPTVSAFTTHLNAVLSRRFWAFVNSCCNRGMETLLPGEWVELFPSLDHIEGVERAMDFRTRLSSLSTEAKEVVEMIFNTPSEILGILPGVSKRSMRGSVRRYLEKSGWKRECVSLVFQEIRETINE